MSKRHTSYKSDTKHGFEAGELAALLAQHAGADYRVVISIRGKVRELIVTEDGPGREAVAGALHDQDAAACLPPVEEGARSEHLPRDFEDDQRHGGKLEAALHDPRTQNFQPEGQTWPAAPPWPASENLEGGSR